MSATPFIRLRDPASLPPALERPVVAIGNFDGVHRGHAAVIDRAKAMAARLGQPCAVLTFEPHPADYFARKSVVFRLTTDDARARLLERRGLDGVIVLSFGEMVAALEAEAFVRDVLVARLGVAGVICGYDFHFGKGRSGSPAFLQDAGARYGFDVEIVERITADAAGSLEAVHSGTIRKALVEGDVAKARALLGHNFLVTGEVIHGQKLGRELGFPTANLELDPSCALRHGIYAVRINIDGKRFNGVASWGRRPTVDNGRPLLEIFVFDFSGNLYGKQVAVAFVEWIRGEEKFDTLDVLKDRIALDVQEAKRVLAQS
ncbi:MAG: bifunctional riboflavin kinase/FAD synthetase [Alphaproteobacteria bacterium]|nr:bifunctional riboflavin kinase/FAD synthetase [Alphaproteobacteria bacterium]